MKFSFVTLFENLIKPYFEDSILKRAIQNNLFCINFINPRNFSHNKFKKVDDYLCGGGAGLLMSPQPLYDCLQKILEEYPKAHIIFVTPAGKTFKQSDAKRLAKKQHLVFVSGRYEGIDERIIEQFADEVLSIGEFILTGGELPSLILADAISRNIPGVLGNQSSLDNESFENDLIEAPSFTKPPLFRGLAISSELLKGNHYKISDLKQKMAIYKTQYYKPSKGKKCETDI